MASPVRPRRRNSINQPPDMSSEISQLNKELNRLHEDVASQIQQHVKKVKNLSNGSKNIYWGAVTVGIMALVGGLAVVLYDSDLTISIVGILPAILVATILIFVLKIYCKKKKKFIRAVEQDHVVYVDNLKFLFDMLERVCLRTEEIMRDYLLVVQNAQILHERFAVFETIRVERVELDEEADQKSKIVHLSGNLSEMIRKVSSVSDILKEISDDNKRRKYSDQKEKTERFINDMLREFGQIKDAVNETRLITNRISKTLKST